MQTPGDAAHAPGTQVSLPLPPKAPTDAILEKHQLEHEGGETTKRSRRCPIPGSIQGQVEWGFGQTAGKLDHLVPVPPMAGTLEIDNL